MILTRTDVKNSKSPKHRGPKFYTIEEAAKYLGISTSTAKHLAADKVLNPDGFISTNRRGRPAHVYMASQLRYVKALLKVAA